MKFSEAAFRQFWSDVVQHADIEISESAKSKEAAIRALIKNTLGPILKRAPGFSGGRTPKAWISLFEKIASSWEDEVPKHLLGEKSYELVESLLSSWNPAGGGDPRLAFLSYYWLHLQQSQTKVSNDLDSAIFNNATYKEAVGTDVPITEGDVEQIAQHRNQLSSKNSPTKISQKRTSESTLNIGNTGAMCDSISTNLSAQESSVPIGRSPEQSDPNVVSDHKNSDIKSQSKSGLGLNGNGPIALIFLAILGLLVAAWLQFFDTSGQNITATAGNGAIAFSGDSNTINVDIGFSREDVQKLVESAIQSLESKNSNLQRKLEEAIRNEGYASDKAKALERELDATNIALASAEEKLADIEGTYAELKETVSNLTQELAELYERSPDVITGGEFDNLIVALHKGNFDIANKILQPVLDNDKISDSDRERAQLYFVGGEISEKQFNYGLAYERYVRAAQLNPNLPDYLMKASLISDTVGFYKKSESFARDLVALLTKTQPNQERSMAFALSTLASSLDSQGKYKEAEDLNRKALNIFKRLLTENHPVTATIYNNLATNLQAQANFTAAEELNRKALDIRKRLLAENHPHIASSYKNLAISLSAQALYVEAEQLYRKALDIFTRSLTESHPKVASAHNSFAINLQKQGKFRLAELSNRKALKINKNLFADYHPSIAKNYMSLANNLNAQNKYSEAEKLHRKSLEINRTVLNESHPEVASNYFNLAVSLYSQRHLSESENMIRTSINILEKNFPNNHPDIVLSYTVLANIMYERGQNIQADDLIVEQLDILERSFPEDHLLTAKAYSTIASALRDRGRHVEAMEVFRKALGIRKRLLSEDHVLTATSFADLGSSLYILYRDAEAKGLLRKAIRTFKRFLPDSDPKLAQSYNNLAAVLVALGEHVEAEKLYRDALNFRERLLSAHHPDTVESYNNLAKYLSARGQYAEAEKLFRKAIDSRAWLNDRNWFRWVNAKSMLAKTLENQNRSAEAIEIYLEALSTTTEKLIETPTTSKGEIATDFDLSLTERANSQKSVGDLLKYTDPAISVKAIERMRFLLIGAIAEIHFQNKNFEIAFKFIEELTTADESDFQALEVEGKMYFSLNDFEAAESVYLKILEMRPVHENAWYELANLSIIRENYSAAERLVVQGLEAVPESAILRTQLALLYQEQQKFDLSIEVYEELYARFPDRVLIANNLASLLADHRGEKPAEIEKAIEIGQKLKDVKVCQWRRKIQPVGRPDFQPL